MSKPDLTGARWRKSSYSNANQACVELAWRKSSRSNGEQVCVELAVLPDTTALRGSKNPAGGALVLNPVAWNAFRSMITTGAFDVQ